MGGIHVAMVAELNRHHSDTAGPQATESTRDILLSNLAECIVTKSVA